MKKLLVTCLALAVLVALPACRSAADKAKAKEDKKLAAEAELAAMKAAVPADSPLAKVNFGMTEGEVGAILGPPSSQDAHPTGKAFNPFNFSGRDTMRMTYYYKGIGRVEFSSGSWGQRNGVVVLQHDPTEPGYRRSQ